MSFPRYPAYKDSGVEWLGEVPEHWEVLPLKRNARLLTEKTDARINPIALENIEGWTGKLIETETEFQGEGVAFLAGDVLFGKLRPYLAKVYLASMPGEAVGDFHVIRPGASLLSRFLQYQLLTNEVIDLVNGSTYGAKMPRASWTFLGSLVTPIPPLEEQPLIATFLDRETAKIDALIAEQQRLIELLQEKRQSVISHAVTKGLNPDAPMKDSGVEWLGKVPAHWEVAPMKHYWLVTDCKHVTAEFTEDGYPLASIREVQGRWVSLETAKRTTEDFYRLLTEGNRKPESGDLVFSRNATVGEVAEVPENTEPFALGQDVVLLKRQNKTHSSSYAWHLLRSTAVVNQLECAMIGSTFRRINVEKIKALAIPVPPAEEQALIATHLQAISDTWAHHSNVACACVALLQVPGVNYVGLAENRRPTAPQLIPAGISC